MTVYVVVIGSAGLHGSTVVGAVYLREDQAKAEVKRLNEANSFTRARYVVRTAEPLA